MILYNLKCSQHHVFEAWFKDSATFDEQVANGEVTCPLCGDGNVRKALMAPNISTRRESRPAAPAEEASMPDAGTEGGRRRAWRLRWRRWRKAKSSPPHRPN